MRLYGPNASVAQDLEPEYIAVAPDSKTAYVTLQENNAFAVIDIWPGTVKEIIPFGYKDWTQSRARRLGSRQPGEYQALAGFRHVPTGRDCDG